MVARKIRAHDGDMQGEREPSLPACFSVYVVVNFLFQLIFIFPLFWGMVMYANEFKTKEKQKLTEVKN